MALKAKIYWKHKEMEEIECMGANVNVGADYSFQMPYADDGTKVIRRIPFDSVYELTLTSIKDTE